ncbi:MAG TPA: BTAD domain-containing putative transcriptional regulator [Trebonia sp.]|nr:BTAD domain-containing putative transcriptional regulator [Trebonia sp.]
MWLAVLGPLSARVGDTDIVISAGKQRAVLVALLARANHVVSFDELASAVWGGDPPPTARVTLRNYVKELRRLLGPAGQDRIVTRDPGYVARFSEDEVDILRFGALCRRGGTLVRTGEWRAAAAVLAEALALWRGDPLADIPATTLHRDTASWLEQQRLQALEWRVDADLHLGNHGGLAVELRDLTARHPLHERFHAQLMLALCRSGRAAEALDAYESARSVLVESLGADPGPELRQLHEGILRGDAALWSPLPATAPAHLPASPPPVASDLVPGAASAGEVVALADPAGVLGRGGARRGAIRPRQLPAGPRHFAGRAGDLAVLSRLLDDPAAGPVICAIGGTAGVGKTALALHFAHQVASQFPDGQLYVNLRGFDPVGPPVSAQEAVTCFLTALGIDPQHVPATLDEQSALYRSLLADRRVLVVLDNAGDVGQIRPLLPGGTGCAVLVTSRDRLAGLVVREGAHPLVLDLLPADEALTLLSHRLGDERIAAERETARDLVRLCARLPLALSVAAARAAATPGLPLARLVASLHDARRRLDGLSTGDTQSDVRAVLSWSFRHVTTTARRMFQLLGLHPGPDISVQAAASLAAVTVAEAEARLRELRDAQLVTEHAPGRFGCHDLLRSYAAELAQDGLSAADRQAAIRRVLDHYLRTAYAADRLLSATRDPITVVAALPGVTLKDLGATENALDWFSAERRALLPAIALAADSGLAAHAWQLAWCLVTYLDWQGHWPEWEAAQRSALAAAGRACDTVGQAHAERQLGRLRLKRGTPAAAEANLLRALGHFRDAGDRVGQARVELDIAVACERQGRYADAIPHILCAHEAFRAAGHRSGQARALNGAGWCLANLGDYRRALSYCAQALAVDRELGSRAAEQDTLHSIGFIHSQLGDNATAISYFKESMRLCEDLGDRYRQADTLASLGDAYRALGDEVRARDAWREALAILVELEHPEADDVRARLEAGSAVTAA